VKSWIRIRINVKSRIRAQIRIKFNNSGAVEAQNEACRVCRTTVADSHNFDSILIRIKGDKRDPDQGIKVMPIHNAAHRENNFFSQHFRNVVLDPDPHFGFMRIWIQHLDYNPKMIYRL
jgi:hypothetical protein